MAIGMNGPNDAASLGGFFFFFFSFPYCCHYYYRGFLLASAGLEHLTLMDRIEGAEEVDSKRGVDGGSNRNSQKGIGTGLVCNLRIPVKTCYVVQC